MATLRERYTELREQILAIPAEAEAAGRKSLNGDEQAKVAELMEKATKIAEQIRDADEAAVQARSGGVKVSTWDDYQRLYRAVNGGGAGATSRVHVAAGWKAVAEELAGAGRAECGLKDLTVTTEPVVAATRVEDTIADLPEDRRYIFPLMPRRDAGNDLAVADYRLVSRGDHAGSTAVERDPTATTDKATIDLERRPGRRPGGERCRRVVCADTAADGAATGGRTAAGGRRQPMRGRARRAPR